MTKLSTTSIISKTNSYGTKKSLSDFYKECIWEWFSKYLTSKGIKFVDNLMYPVIRKWNSYEPCLSGNEKTCFYLTIEEAEKGRLDVINDLKKRKDCTLTEID